LAPHERDAAAGGQPRPADEAADGAGAEDSDLRAGRQGSAAAAIGRHVLAWKPQTRRRLARLPEDVDRNAAARIPVAADAEPQWLQLGIEALGDADRAILV